MSLAFGGYDGRFSTILDSGLLHALPPEKRQDYLQSIFRAAAPGAALHILAFAAGALGDQTTARAARLHRNRVARRRLDALASR